MFLDLVSTAVATVGGLTALVASARHYRAVLAARTQRKTEVETAQGFFGGMVFGIVILIWEAFV